MPPKKKTKKKSKKTVVLAPVDVPKFEYTPPEEVDEQWVILNIRLIAWTYLDFTFEIIYYS